VDISIVVSAQLLLLFSSEASQRLGQITASILAADHEADLARWVGWDRGVGVFDIWEDFFAVLLELGDQWEMKPLVLGLSSNDSAFLQSTKEKLKVGLLEQALSWSLWVGGVSDDDIKFILIVIQELEAISDVDLDLWVLIADGHSWEVLLGETNDSLVNITQDSFLHTIVLDNFPENTTITTANDQYLLRARVREHGQMCNHLLISKLVSLGALNDIVKNEDGSVVGRFED